VHDVYRGGHQCLSVAKRKHLYYMLFNRDNAYSIVSRRFRVSVRALRRIIKEGGRKHWPAPPAPGSGETVQHRAARAIACFRSFGAQVEKGGYFYPKDGWIAWWGKSWREDHFVGWKYSVNNGTVNGVGTVRGNSLTEREGRAANKCP
jgi:hypothetical protein